MDDFTDATSYVTQFDNVRPVYDYERNQDAQKYKRRDALASAFAADLDKLKEWEDDIDKMRVQHSIGALYIDAKRLKAELQPIALQALDNVRAVVKEVALEKSRELLALLVARTKTLGACVCARACRCCA